MSKAVNDKQMCYVETCRRSLSVVLVIWKDSFFLLQSGDISMSLREVSGSLHLLMLQNCSLLY